LPFRAQARGEGGSSCVLPGRYYLPRLRDDFRRQWGKQLHTIQVGCTDLVDMLRWELFSGIVRVEDEDVVAGTK
jgi:hypothetical protein